MDSISKKVVERKVLKFTSKEMGFIGGLINTMRIYDTLYFLAMD